MNVDLAIGTLRRPKPGFGPADPCSRQLAHLDDARPVRAAIDGCAARHVVRRNAPLLVGRACKGYRGLPAENGVDDLDDVTRRVDVGIARAQMLVHDDVPTRSEGESCCLGQLGTRPHTGRDDCEIRRQPFAVVEDRLHAVGTLHEIGDRPSEADVDSHAAQLRRERLRHFGIHRRQHVFAALHDRHIKSALAQVLRDFKSDEPRADDNHTSW